MNERRLLCGFILPKIRGYDEATSECDVQLLIFTLAQMFIVLVRPINLVNNTGHRNSGTLWAHSAKGIVGEAGGKKSGTAASP